MSIPVIRKKLKTGIRILKEFPQHRRRYGTLHATASYLGKVNPHLWRLIGKAACQNYIRHYLDKHQTRILNLGGGSNCINNCLTVDINPFADAYVDITKKLPFCDNSIDAIFCEEVIEHFSLNAGIVILRECRRILKPGGILRIITPNLDWFAKRLSQSVAVCDEINLVFYGHGHRYLYTQKRLEDCCKKVGFTNLAKSSYRDPDSNLGYLDSHCSRYDQPPERSQYLEMSKISC